MTLCCSIKGLLGYDGIKGAIGAIGADVSLRLLNKKDLEFYKKCSKYIFDLIKK